MYIAISAAGAFRTDDEGKTWKPINQGLHSQYIPDPNAEVGHCVHHIAMHPARPNTLFMQKHWDVMRSDDGGENWHEISGNLPTDFGFPIDVHAHEPETIYVVPIKSDSEHFPPEGKLREVRGNRIASGFGAGLAVVGGRSIDVHSDNLIEDNAGDGVIVHRGEGRLTALAWQAGVLLVMLLDLEKVLSNDEKIELLKLNHE